MDIYIWSILKWDYVHCNKRWRSTIQSAKTRPGTDFGSITLIAKFRLRLKKVGKTARPFRYDLNQIPYDYTVMINWFKGLELIECLKNFGQRSITLYRIINHNTEENIINRINHNTEHNCNTDQNHPKEKEMQEGKVVVQGGFTQSWEKKKS